MQKPLTIFLLLELGQKRGKLIQETRWVVNNNSLSRQKLFFLLHQKFNLVDRCQGPDLVKHMPPY
jgi:hypothetical protein